jgi:hypothetical protein
MIVEQRLKHGVIARRQLESRLRHHGKSPAGTVFRSDASSVLVS